MNSYITLDHLRRYLGLTAAQTSDDDLLLRVAEAASRLLDRCTGRQFYPERQRQSYSYTHSSYLPLGNDLLTIHALTNGDGSILAPSAYHLHPANESVKSSILLDRSAAIFMYRTDPVDAITVDGTWGFHPAWDLAWTDSGDSVQDNPLSANAQTLTVSDADAPHASGYWTRFAVGQLLQIEDEYLHVLHVDAGENTLTVTRGANGTTPAEHAQNTPITIYQPPQDVQQACLRVASWLYKQKDAGFIQAASSLRGQITVPPALPDDVQQILAPYVRIRVS